MKNLASDIDQVFIEDVITELIKDNANTNKKTATSCDSFYRTIGTEEERANNLEITANCTPAPLKSRLSPSKKSCYKSPLEMEKNVFFHVESSFRS